MSNSTNPPDNADAAALTDNEMLDILRRVQSGELSVAQAEQLLGAASGEREEQESSDLALDSQDFSAPLGKTANGKLVFERGAAGLTLHGEQLSGQLFVAYFERHVPIVRVNGGTVTIRYRDFSFGWLNWLRYGFNPPRSRMTLNADIPWRIVIRGGIAQSRLDLRPVKLRGATLNSGVSDVELMLGEPNGVVNLDFGSGVHNVSILRPADVAVRLTVHGGAANLALDSQKLGAVGGRTSLETPNSREAPSYYAIIVNGGANNFRVAAL